MSIYTLKDIGSGQNYDLTISSGMLNWTPSSNVASVNPVVLDVGDNTTRWQIEMYFGMIQWIVVTNTAVTPIFYLQDTTSNLYYELAINFGELEWFVTTPVPSSTGGSSGPLNPNDVYRIFEKKKYQTRITVEGKRIVASSMLLAVLGSTKYTVSENIKVRGNRMCPLRERKEIEGVRI